MSEPTCESCHERVYDVTYYCVDCATEIFGRAPEPPLLELVRGGTYFDQPLVDGKVDDMEPPLDEELEEGSIAEWVEAVSDDPMYRDDPDGFRVDYTRLQQQWEEGDLSTLERIATLREWLEDLEEEEFEVVREEGEMERYGAAAQQQLVAIRNNPLYRDDPDGFREDFETLQRQWEEGGFNADQRSEIIREWLVNLEEEDAEFQLLGDEAPHRRLEADGRLVKEGLSEAVKSEATTGAGRSVVGTTSRATGRFQR